MLLRSVFTSATLAIIVAASGCSKDEAKPADPVAAQPGPANPSTPEPTPPPAPQLSTEPVYFGFDDYTLSAEAQSKLTTMADALKAGKSITVQIEGHCDERGTVEYNLALGERRAQSVKNFLTQLGVDAARLATISYGEEKPVAQGHSEDAWSKNRRAEFNVTAK